LAGLAFKISVVPFHMWTPDVYEGAPTPVTTFFATAPKMAAMAILTRVLVDAFPGVTREWQQVVTFLAIASMALGAFAALTQTNIKRLMAYSSISNMGYALVGLASGSVQGVEGIAIFMAIYLAMTLGAFACILTMTTSEGRVEKIDDLAGLSRTNPYTAAMLMLIMFSMIGIPPLAGFFGKFYVFAAAIKANLFALAVLGILTSVVSAYYYLRIVKVMYLDAPRVTFVPVPGEVKLVMTLAGLFVLLFWVYPQPLKDAAEAAARSLF
ncbi:MAG: NADH-quinone oxidoreductase subunit N, partial [Proteobacteria bacterium]|nr:NADH-quinone oxidoreductase subunit N [Pseudomonadota bacterium]